MHHYVSDAAVNSAMRLDRRQFLESLIIAAAGAIGMRGTVAFAGSSDMGPTADDWQSVLETMFPHTGIDPALYGVPAGALVGAAEKDATARQLLESGWQTLSGAAGGDWGVASGEARESAIAAIVATPFFAMLRQTTVYTFYGNPKVWEAFGYEGDAWSFGGYLRKGVDTIDWLPLPPAPISGP